MYLRGSVQGIFTLPTTLHHDVSERLCAGNLCFTNNTTSWCTWEDLCREVCFTNHSAPYDVHERICAGNFCFIREDHPAAPLCTWVDRCRNFNINLGINKLMACFHSAIFDFSNQFDVKVIFVSLMDLIIYLAVSGQNSRLYFDILRYRDNLKKITCVTYVSWYHINRKIDLHLQPFCFIVTITSWVCAEYSAILNFTKYQNPLFWIFE